MAVLLTILTDPRDPTPRRTLALPPNTSILKSAHAASIEITATCGGRGRCTSCRVKFGAGTIPPPTIMDEIQLGNDLVREGYRLSCQCVPSEAVTVQVAPPLEERAFQILGAGPGVVGMGRVTLDSGIRKQVVKVSLPREEHHQISDLEQLAAALGVTPTDVGLAVLQGLPAALRDDPAGVTVTTFAPPGGRGSERVVAVERGDTAGMKFGLAVDIGTTSVVSTLIELDSGEQLASVSSLNPQAVFGGDLMSRIAFAQFGPGNLRKLHTRIIGLLNRHIEEACRQSGVLAKWIYKVVVVGNTGMHHRLWACSAPAGPALEGAQIRHGMRGALGAIDRVTVDDDIHVHTIGEADPLGICGSGLIDLLAGLLDTGVIDWTGLIRVEAREALPPKLRERVVMRGEERQVIVLRPGEASARQEIVLTQDDVRQVQLAKGAIASGVAMLQHVAGVSDETVTELMLPGGFGNYVSISSALRIGLIPPLPTEKIRYVGNAASLAAQLCLVSETERQRAESVAASIEHVSLAAHPDFERIFVDAMNFPRPGRPA